MAYLSQFGDDIFFSYAHVDDEAASETGHGWVTETVRTLKMELARKFGRNDAYAMWVDHDLRRSQPVTPQILDRVRRSAILVAILSPGYLASDWCRQEREAFIGVARQPGTSNIFLVEIDDCDRPLELADLSPVRFWSRGPKGGAARPFGWPWPGRNDHEYYGGVQDLAQAIFDEMRLLKTALPDASNPAGVAGTTARAEPGQNGCVFLAQVTDDLDTERKNMRRFLEQADVRVVPAGEYSQEPAAFRKAVAADLAEADLFVQLLSEVAGRRPPDLPDGYPLCQLQLALDAARPVSQWRSPRLDPHTVEDESHRELLERSTVSAEPIEDFKQAIRRRLHDIRNPPPRTPSNAFIFVDMDSADRSLAENLCDILDRYGAGYELPLDTQDPGEARRNLEDSVSRCDALMVIYGSTTMNWVHKRLRECHKALINRARPPRGLALIQGPPGPKDRLSIRLPNMEVLDCQSGVDEAAIAKFLGGLGERVA
jgi:hypothetical protein